MWRHDGLTSNRVLCDRSQPQRSEHWRAFGSSPTAGINGNDRGGIHLRPMAANFCGDETSTVDWVSLREVWLTAEKFTLAACALWNTTPNSDGIRGPIFFLQLRSLWCFNHTPRFDAWCTDHHFLSPSILHGPNTLQVWIESAFVHIVGVAHMVTHHWFFATDFTYLCHFSAPLEILHPMVCQGRRCLYTIAKTPP